MAVFGIEKNEYGGGKLTPVEGGAGGSNYILFANDSSALYKDEAMTDGVTGDELTEMFMTGKIIVVAGNGEISTPSTCSNYLNANAVEQGAMIHYTYGSNINEYFSIDFVRAGK